MIPALERPRQRFTALSQPRLQSEFEARLNYQVRPCLILVAFEETLLDGVTKATLSFDDTSYPLVNFFAIALILAFIA